MSLSAEVSKQLIRVRHIYSSCLFPDQNRMVTHTCIRQLIIRPEQSYRRSQEQMNRSLRNDTLAQINLQFDLLTELCVCL
jgi:hypothetical protein